jgi:CheY-like chemotaxis protein
MKMRQGLLVFVVDDRPMIAYTLSAVLREQGHSVIPYTNPLLALHDARIFAPDVLISDVEMPELEGVELAIQLKELCPECKIFLMSGHLGPIQSLENARQAGFDFPFFAKPVSALTFVKQLEGLLVTRCQRLPAVS